MNNCQKFPEAVFCYQEDGKFYDGSAEDFIRLTGAQWTSELRGDMTNLSSRISPTSSDLALDPHLRSLYESSCRKLPTLYIKKGLPGQNTLHAKEEIKKGNFIAEYLGYWEPDSHTNSCYRWGPINGQEFRNYGAMIDDGFPNVQAFYLFGCQSAPLRVIFVALEDIPAGEMITTNYGMGHSVKTLPRFEHRLKAMLSYFSIHSLKDTARAVRDGISQQRDCLEFEQILGLEEKTAKLQYVFQTPSAILSLLLENIVTVSQVFDIYDKIDNRLYLLGFYSGRNWKEKEISNSIEKLRTWTPGSSLAASFFLPPLEGLN